MISVVVPTLNSEGGIVRCLEALVPSAIDDILQEVIVVDGGSTDRTKEICEEFGAKVFASDVAGRGPQLILGAQNARADWILFLHSDCQMQPGWHDEVFQLMDDKSLVGVFTLRFDVKGFRASIVAWGAMLRTRFFNMPYGDQGLLISRQLYQKIGGYSPMPLFEDVDLIERLLKVEGHSCLRIFESEIITSASRYVKNGFLPQILKNFWRILQYKIGVDPQKIAERYNK